MNSLGIYISVPFCRAKCTYCNFASGVSPASAHKQYVARVCEEVRSGVFPSEEHSFGNVQRPTDPVRPLAVAAARGYGPTH